MGVIVELTEAEYETVRRLIGKDTVKFRMDSNSGDTALENLSSVILPGREKLLSKFPVRLSAHPRITAHFPPEVF